VATDDLQVLVTGNATAPATFTVPGNGQIRPKAVFASYDGTGAGGDFVPALKVTSDGGELVCVCPCATTVTAGASADVSWFQGLAATGGGSGVVTLGNKTGTYGSAVGANIASGANADLDWTHSGGDAVLDVSTPTQPSIIVAGLYWVGISIQGSGFGASKSLAGTFTTSYGIGLEGIATANKTSTNDVLLSVFIGGAQYMPANTIITANATNMDSSTRNIYITQAAVSLLAY
jgi:hypothetical protein